MQTLSVCWIVWQIRQILISIKDTWAHVLIYRELRNACDLITCRSPLFPAVHLFCLGNNAKNQLILERDNKQTEKHQRKIWPHLTQALNTKHKECFFFF